MHGGGYQIVAVGSGLNGRLDRGPVLPLTWDENKVWKRLTGHGIAGVKVGTGLGGAGPTRWI